MRYQVTEGDTAAAVGSGDVGVLATPRLIAWMEAETVRAAASLVGPDQTTVGTAVRIDHVKATAVGGAVEVSARLTTDGQSRHLTFALTAVDDSGQRVGGGEIDRVVVDRARFLRSVQPGSGADQSVPMADGQPPGETGEGGAGADRSSTGGTNTPAP